MLPAEIVQQVRRIQIMTGRQVADVLAGQYLSVFKGPGIEFDEVRPYVPGDDVRAIDWNVTARTGAPFVKRYVDERQLTVLLVVDVSASQDFGSVGRSKREAAAELSALLAFSASQNDDKVGLLLFHGQAEEYIPPRKGQRHALRVVREVLAHDDGDRAGAGQTAGGSGAGTATGDVPPGGQATGLGPRLSRFVSEQLRRLRAFRHRDPRRATNIAGALEFCRRVLPRRAVIFLVSDFLDQGYLDALRNTRRRHDVIAVQVVDQREQRPAPAGLVALEDAETGRLALVDTASPAFHEAVVKDTRRRIERLEADVRSSGVDLVRVDAAGSTVEPLVAFFRMRQRRLRR